MPRLKDVVKDKVHVAELFSIYGPLLSERQRNFINLHYNEDLSLSEIAEGESISRQAVFDAIKQGKKRLEKFESVLQLKSRTAGKEVVAEPVSPPIQPGEGNPKDQIEERLEEMEGLSRSGVIYDTQKVRRLVSEIRDILKVV